MIATAARTKRDLENMIDTNLIVNVNREVVVLFAGSFIPFPRANLGDTHIHMGLKDDVRGLSGVGFGYRLNFAPKNVGSLIKAT